MSASWAELERRAPVLAELGRDRLVARRVGLLGTLREAGAPRISPIEPYFVEAELMIGALAWSQKVRDLRRDPRYVLHSAITDADGGEGELKLSGPAVEVIHEARPAPMDAWWSAWPAEAAVVFRLEIDEAVFVEWDIGGGRMTVHRWSAPRGYNKSHRRYP